MLPFGDITLPGTTARMISVVVMFAGVTLFLRLAQALFRPSKVRFPCPSCGLQRHEPDAVHCKRAAWCCVFLTKAPIDANGRLMLVRVLNYHGQPKVSISGILTER